MDDEKQGIDNDDDSKESNLWRDFLKSAMEKGGRGQQNTGHLIVFGDTNSGKSSLVSHFGKLENKLIEMKKIFNDALCVLSLDNIGLGRLVFSIEYMANCRTIACGRT